MVLLRDIAHCRSGDKGDVVNIGVIATEPEYYEIIEERVTADKVEKHFEEMCTGPVERYPLPNLHAFNYVLQGALDGGGQRSLRIDQIGKGYAGGIQSIDIGDI